MVHLELFSHSREILGGLAMDRIGTDNPDLIARDNAPPLRRSMTIKVHWRRGDDLGDRIYVQEKSLRYASVPDR